MTDGQVQQIVDAIRAHTRAMVAERLWAQAEAGTDVNHVVADADALLAALSASSGGDEAASGERSVSHVSGDDRNAGDVLHDTRSPGSPALTETQAATPPLSADLVTVRRDDLAWVVAVLSIHGECTTRWNRLRDVVSR